MKFEFISAGNKANIDGAKLLAGSNSLFIEEKFDGSRYGLVLYNNVWRAISRNGIDRAKNIPYIIDSLKQLGLPDGTVLDCEVIVMDNDRKKRWELSRSVMGTTDYNPNVVEANLLIFDIQHLGQESFMKQPYLTRREAIKSIIKSNETFDTYISNGCLSYPRAWKVSMLNELWDNIVTKGEGEGLMIKNNAVANYGKDWTKVKKEDTADAFIIGATSGKGKYAGQIGALELAVYNKGSILSIGNCSGMDDSTRKKMTDMAIKKELLGKVIEVKFNEVTKNYKLRHPRFIRWRHDKSQIECLLEQLNDMVC